MRHRFRLRMKVCAMDISFIANVLFFLFEASLLTRLVRRVSTTDHMYTKLCGVVICNPCIRRLKQYSNMVAAANMLRKVPSIFRLNRLMRTFDCSGYLGTRLFY